MDEIELLFNQYINEENINIEYNLNIIIYQYCLTSAVLYYNCILAIIIKINT